MTNKTKDNPIPNFEKALKELEAIVSKMEGGDLTLEASLKQFEKGISLARNCQLALKHAEQRIEQLADEKLNTQNDTDN